MLDRDLVNLYQVETRVLNQAVSRNTERYPEMFMFQLTQIEYEILKSQIVISSWGGSRNMPLRINGCWHYLFICCNLLASDFELNAPQCVLIDIPDDLDYHLVE